MHIRYLPKVKVVVISCNQASMVVLLRVWGRRGSIGRSAGAYASKYEVKPCPTTTDLPEMGWGSPNAEGTL